jgi:hypothetical protein
MQLEDFIIGIHNTHIKEYLTEAINSYNAGSYRACITYTWLAVFIDINNKIEQLSMLGEQEATNIVNLIEKIRKENNIPEMLKFEREILALSKNRFSLFDDITLIDLQRIQEDRNRSVHPLFSYDGSLYRPTAEQARAHLINAYNKLLSEPNVYGKAVIDRLFELLYSSVFPIDYSKAKVVLEGSYLKSPKDSLLRNFVISLLKQYLKEDLEITKIWAIENTIKFLLEKNRGKTESVLNEILSNIVDFANAEELFKLINLFKVDSVFFSVFDDAKKVLVKNYIEQFPIGNIELLIDLLDIKEISSNIEFRVEQVTRDELYDITPFLIPKILRKKIVKEYIDSDNFDQANSFARVVITAIPEMQKDEIEILISGIANNGQVSGSWQVGAVLHKVLSNKKFDEGECLNIINANNLGYKLTGQ